MGLAASGRKAQHKFVTLDSLQRFHKFLIKCEILADTEAFTKLKEDARLHFSPLVQYNATRLLRKKQETVEKVENYPIQDYVFLLNGEEINIFGRRWAAFDFSNAPLPKVGTILSVTQGSAYLN